MDEENHTAGYRFVLRCFDLSRGVLRLSEDRPLRETSGPVRSERCGEARLRPDGSRPAQAAGRGWAAEGDPRGLWRGKSADVAGYVCAGPWVSRSCEDLFGRAMLHQFA